jgi:hypothetical protein
MNPSLMAMVRPFSSAHIFASLFMETPNPFAYIMIMFPSPFLKIPLKPAKPRFPLETPSKFHFTNPSGGGD